VNKLNQLARAYGQFHQSKTNKILHMIGVPMVIASLLMMTDWFTISFLTHGSVQLSWLLIAAITIYYFQIDKKVALSMLGIFVVLNLFMILIALPMLTKTKIITAIALFVIGWILNFIGHGIEGKKPAFLHNVMQTLIAPIFITQEIAGLFKIKLFDIS
jgi:uncharacterized membrane protein YGL010W